MRRTLGGRMGKFRLSLVATLIILILLLAVQFNTSWQVSKKYYGGRDDDNNLLYLSGVPHSKVPSSEIIKKIVKITNIDILKEEIVTYSTIDMYKDDFFLLLK